MTKDDVFGIIKAQLLSIQPDLDPNRVTPNASMRDLGVNSVDRADVIIQSMEALRLKVRLHEVGSLKDLQELVNFFHARLPLAPR